MVSLIFGILISISISVNVCVLFCFRGSKKAPTEPMVQAIQQVAVPFDIEMSYSSASNFEETEDISDEGGRGLIFGHHQGPDSHGDCEVSACFHPWGRLHYHADCGLV